MSRRVAKKEREAARRTPKEPNPPAADSVVNGRSDAGGDEDGGLPAKSRRRRIRFGVVVFMVLAGAAVVGLWRPWRGSGSVGRLNGSGRGFNVVLITLDTTRVDCLGCYGHPVVKTPNIDALAREGVLFRQCMTAAPITLPSHASIMTSTYPFVHRARMNGRYLADKGNVTIAEVLREAGYTTGAEIGAYVLDAIWGIDQGFDHYRSETTPEQRGERFERLATLESEPADAVCNRAVEWLDTHASEDFFLWVHFFDPHQPWTAPERFSAPYADPRFGPYLGEISFVDEQIGRLVNELRRLGVADRTLIVLTADHGEGLYQHKEISHVYYVYDSTMHVPLIFWCPSRIPRGREIDCQVRTVDITPTLLAFLGLEPKPDAQGVSLLPLLSDEKDDLHLVAFGESVEAHNTYGYARLRTLRTDGWKYIHAPKPELYDIRNDPGEMVNLVGRHREHVATLRGTMERLIAESLAYVVSEEQVGALDATAAEKLAALGYVGGYAPQDSTKSELELFSRFEGDDPKDHIDSWAEFQVARAWMTAKQPDKAEAILQKLIAAEPSSPAFRERYAVLLREAGRYNESVQQYQALLELQPGNAAAHFQVGTLYGELNQLDTCLDHLLLAVAAMPEYPEAHTKLGLGLALQGKLKEAESHFKTALTLDPTDSQARMGMASLMHRDGRYAEAVQMLREGLRYRPEATALANDLAWRLATLPSAELRDGAEAVRIAESAIERLEQASPAVLDTLAAAYAEAGRFEEAVATARRALDLAESREQVDVATQIQEHLALYEAGQAYHEGS